MACSISTAFKYVPLWRNVGRTGFLDDRERLASLAATVRPAGRVGNLPGCILTALPLFAAILTIAIGAYYTAVDQRIQQWRGGLFSYRARSRAELARGAPTLKMGKMSTRPKLPADVRQASLRPHSTRAETLQGPAQVSDYQTPQIARNDLICTKNEQISPFFLPRCVQNAMLHRDNNYKAFIVGERDMERRTHRVHASPLAWEGWATHGAVIGSESDFHLRKSRGNPPRHPGRAKLPIGWQSIDPFYLSGRLCYIFLVGRPVWGDFRSFMKKNAIFRCSPASLRRPDLHAR